MSSTLQRHFDNLKKNILSAAFFTIENHLACKHKNSIGDAHTPQPGKIVFNTMRYRSSETVQRSGYFQFQSSVSYCKVLRLSMEIAQLCKSIYNNHLQQSTYLSHKRYMSQKWQVNTLLQSQRLYLDDAHLNPFTNVYNPNQCPYQV